MAKILLLGKTPLRILKRRNNSIVLQPLDTEYPHRTLFRLPGETKWLYSPHGSDRGSLVEWYRQVNVDHFEKIGTGKW